MRHYYNAILLLEKATMETWSGNYIEFFTKEEDARKVSEVLTDLFNEYLMDPPEVYESEDGYAVDINIGTNFCDYMYEPYNYHKWVDMMYAEYEEEVVVTVEDWHTACLDFINCQKRIERLKRDFEEMMDERINKAFERATKTKEVE